MNNEGLSYQSEIAIKKCYEYCTKNNKYTTIIDELSLSERIYALRLIASSRLINKEQAMFLSHLFKESELPSVLNILEKDEERKCFLFCLSDDAKLASIRADHNLYKIIEELIPTFKDKEKIIELIFYIINNIKFKQKDISLFLKYIPSKLRNLFLTQLFTKLNEQDTLIDSSCLKDILEQLPKKDIIKTYELYSSIFKTNKTLFLLEMIKLVEEKDRIKFFAVIMKDKPTFFVSKDFGCLLNIIPEKDYVKALYILKEADKLTGTYLGVALKEVPLELHLKIINIIYCKEDLRALDILDAYYIAQLISLYPLEEGKKIFKNLIIDKTYLSLIKVLRNLNIYGLAYEYADYYIETKGILDDKTFNELNGLLTSIKKPTEFIEYKHIIELYCNRYKLDYKNTLILIEKLSYEVLNYLRLPNFKQLINLPTKEFLKIIDIFNESSRTLDKNTLNDICNAIIQREFRIKRHDEYRIFNEFERIISEHEFDVINKLQTLLIKLGKKIDVITFLMDNNLSFDNFINGLVEGKNISLLHDMTNEYIKKCREDYAKTRLPEIYDELNVITKIEKTTFKREIFRSSSYQEFKRILKNIPLNELTPTEEQLILNDEILYSIYEFKKDPTKFKGIIKPYLKTIESLLNKAYQYAYESALFSDTDYPVTYYVEPVSNKYILDIINNININQVRDRLITDTDAYEALKSFLRKYKLLGWGITFSPLEEKADFIFNEGTIGALISNFYEITKEINPNTGTLTQYIDIANCYDEDSTIYSLMLGKEVYRAISTNQGENKSTEVRKKRLDEIPNLVRKMYACKYITVPGIDDIYSSSNGHEARITVGNKTDMNNMIMGEKTNSCLRIYGAFYDLYKFILTDKNGFNICFTDPETNEFITRVAGIRNGNTVFLNELRLPVNKKYKNEELVEMLANLASDLITKTENSKYPIENVIISDDLAMNKYKDLATPLRLEDSLMEPFYGLSFNLKKNGSGILLSSASKQDAKVPYKFGYNECETYEPPKTDTKYSRNEDEAIDMYIQINILRQVLEHTELSDIEIPLIDNLVSSVSSSDYCVSLDNKGAIHIIRIRDEPNKELDTQIEEATNYLLETINKEHTLKLGGNL